MTEPAALAFEERQFSLPQLDALADGLAATLAKRGLARRSTRSRVMASNRPEFVAALLAIWRLGATVGAASVPRGSATRSTTHSALTHPSHAVGDHPVLAGLMPMLHLDEPIAPAEPTARLAAAAGRRGAGVQFRHHRPAEGRPAHPRGAG